MPQGKTTDFSSREGEKASERERESTRGRGRREGERDALGLTIFKHVLICVNTKAITDEGEKKDKRQHKYDASLK